VSTLVITAASEAFAPSLFALLGSLKVNWPGAPPALVYDIGLDTAARRVLARHDVEVRAVPPFCAHWRRHFTWKLWCLVDAPAPRVVWMDAGLVVLRPLDEVVDALDAGEVFVTTNHELLDWEASESACRGCGVPPDQRLGKMTLAGGLMGFNKRGRVPPLLDEALRVAMHEEHIAATEVTHRHDQAILSLLVYKHLGDVVVADSATYLGSLSPTQVPGQKIWVHRRAIRPQDAAHFAAALAIGGPPYRPTPRHDMARAVALAHLYRVYWSFGQGRHADADARLAAAFASDPGLSSEAALLAGRLASFDRRWRELPRSAAEPFVPWALGALRRTAGPELTARVEGELAGRGALLAG
jgi:hypothetical protein